MKKSFLSFLLFSFLLVTTAAAGTNPVTNNSNNNNNNSSDSTATASAAGHDHTVVTGKGNSIEDEKTDTVKYSVSNAIITRYWDVNDSLTYIPAYDTYCQWDTSNIHPYQFNQITWDDTTTLVLKIETESPYTHPFMGNVTSNFGYRRSRMHYGIDINLETGDTVVSAFDGKVRIAKMNKSYGNLVVVRHNNGLETYYAHLSELMVMPDQEVQAGQPIGLGGNTGRSYGSHLHFEVRYKGFPIDPNELIDFTEKRLLADTFCITRKHVDDLGVVKKSGAGTKSAAGKGTKYYTVRKGDTLSGIARRYGTTPQKIAQKNGMSVKATLRVGMKLKV